MPTLTHPNFSHGRARQTLPVFMSLAQKKDDREPQSEFFGIFQQSWTGGMHSHIILFVADTFLTSHQC